MRFVRPILWPILNFRFRSGLTAIFILTSIAASSPAQSFGNNDREAGRDMLSMIQLDVEKNYYDPTFHGIDTKARFKTADERIKQAKSNGEINGIIAQALIDFEDSHLFFLPPPRAAEVRYGWRMQMIGNKFLATAVQPGSDADQKGLKPGDEIVSIDGIELNPGIFWKVQYLYNALRPKAGVRLVVKGSDGTARQLDILSKVEQQKKMVDLTDDTQNTNYFLHQDFVESLNRHRYLELGDDVFIWKMPQFDLEDKDVDVLMGKAKNHKALIIDLRGNGGGAVTMLQRLVGSLLDHDVKLWDEKRRKETKELKAKTRGNDVYKGKLFVLVDSDCASAAELFPRIMQLEKRGTVIGDHTSGKVMESVQYFHREGVEIVIPYGVSVTVADLIMTDGKSLEQNGVVPDELLIPTAQDMAAGRDPVLARAIELAGVKIDPVKAGSMFPIEWRK